MRPGSKGRTGAAENLAITKSALQKQQSRPKDGPIIICVLKIAFTPFSSLPATALGCWRWCLWRGLPLDSPNS